MENCKKNKSKLELKRLLKLFKSKKSQNNGMKDKS